MCEIGPHLKDVDRLPPCTFLRTNEMGDVADMMLDGTLCEGCGVFMDGEAPDYPRLCSDCAKDRRAAGRVVERNGEFWIDCGDKKPQPVAKVKCPTCGRKVKPVGLSHHQRDVHKKEQK